jgi:hypothetical protein
MKFLRNRFEHDGERIDDSVHNETEQEPGKDDDPPVKEFVLLFFHSPSSVHVLNTEVDRS